MGRLLRPAVLALVAGSFPAIGRAQEPPPLGPDDLALLFNANMPASRELAEYYARRRAVPADRLIGIRCTTQETIRREDFAFFAERLRVALRQARLEHRVRCLVTFYGLPIRVGAGAPCPA